MNLYGRVLVQIGVALSDEARTQLGDTDTEQTSEHVDSNHLSW